ncbi:MAG: 30S ribosomal protein S19e [Candidatus Aenigmarchaeota archaeon ex4484_52]|nr:MAG: 30S ribosomal protein S19e [Candidatus Aenigmarchaeota archaeon ex4484_52]
MDINIVDRQKLINQLSSDLQKEKTISIPNWINFVKTGIHKKKIPDDKNWWFFRIASILCFVSTRQIGVSRLRVKYGGRKNRGYKPEKFKKAAGNNIRKALQQLEKLDLVEKNKKGRKLTLKGMKYIENAIKNIC